MTLKDSALDPLALQDHLKQYVKLKEFNYNFGSTTADSNDYNGAPPHFRQALLVVKDTLEDLYIDTTGQYQKHGFSYLSVRLFSFLIDLFLDSPNTPLAPSASLRI